MFRFDNSWLLIYENKDTYMFMILFAVLPGVFAYVMFPHVSSLPYNVVPPIYKLVYKPQ